MLLEPVIGLETHVELRTKTKMFCGCSAHGDTSVPNTNVCPICTGHPGTLPVPNAEAIRFAILLGLALKGTITEHSKFDRKNYFYPDLPKAYQISQFDLPIMRDGELLVDVPGEETSRIGIERMHLEEDSAKNIHGDNGKAYIDFNRSSVPLCEIVTKPDFRNAAEAKAYVQELRLLVRTLGISDGDLERGHLRCDVNVSLREIDEKGLPIGPLNPKTEIKNINSFRAIERAIQYEIKRQTALWEAGTPPMITTTRGWNDSTQTTDEQRTKEDSADYRYFPEPDIPPLDLRDLVTEIKRKLPELPRAKRARFIEEYGLKAEEARQIVDDEFLANYTEALFSELKTKNWFTERTEDQQKLVKFVSGWLLTKYTGVLNSQGKSYKDASISPENFAEVLTRIAHHQLSMQKGLEVVKLMESDGVNTEQAIETLGAGRVSDSNALDTIVAEVLNKNPNEVTRYKSGETKLLPYFLGQIMKASKGNAEPDAATEALKKALD
ncbi:MAG: Asp-tRNA(Asn)/Glu-tRNA(Gln) amidotransferase subunit GatB [Patescibacteria group bacterium]